MDHAREDMPDHLIDILARISHVLVDRRQLTPMEHVELLRIAQGVTSEESAAAANVSPHTVRSRRRRLCHKLGVVGGAEQLAPLIADALRQLTPENTGTLDPPDTEQNERCLAINIPQAT